MPVYDGATISLQESLLAILTFALTHKLTGLCISGLLSLIGLHCGPNNLLMNSHYKFKICQEPLDKKDSVRTRDRSHKNSEYFIEFPILSQLQSMFTRPASYESLQFRCNRVKREDTNIEDIYDGEIYQRFLNSGFLSNPNNLSFFMYFDGISLFKSSTFSIWPVYFTINELKYKLRTTKEKTILAGLWFGETKPNPNHFLRPLRESLSHWENTGEVLNLPNGQNVRVHAKLLGAVGDLPAKALFMRFMQYNGAFSCSNCMERGTRFDVGNNTIQVFPYSRNFELRTIEDTNDYAAQALHATRVFMQSKAPLCYLLCYLT
ncbi:hypothetical protein ONE63_011502 [Megalurothrips usitatus]|uniref:Uncharacterized protein n=1 Tax=Megalurothrips usitatus TaxID=439358 RepID=A0AAV7WZ53_9NEOP|nr:hypothetical protein ONE63_011502 [Megalurothrips usitatus]